MRLGDLLGRLDRLQKSLWFKVVASALVVGLGLTVLGVQMVNVQRVRAEEARQTEAEGVATRPDLSDLPEEERKQAESYLEAIESTRRAARDLLSGRADSAGVAVGVATGIGLALAVVWIGQGLTGLVVLVLLAGICGPLLWYGNPTWRGVGRFVAGVGLLGFSFSVLMELLRLAFSGPWAIAAIARNVVNEAVRIKVSAVFIVLLLLALAALPGLLQESTPLRYRVQSFLQYGTAGAFWIIAILVVFLSVSTVAFEQRERVIWQTMTKPVAAWQYLLGKWLGVVGVAAVLLGVSASGVFLFTEYLRDQRAIGEWAPYRAQEGIASEDRLVLESQVLTARAVAGPELGQVVTDEIVARTVQQNLQAAKTNDPSFEIDQAGIDQMVQEVREQLRTQYLTIEPGNREVYLFTGLEGAKQLNKPISLRFRVNVGGNDPRGVFRITFLTENMAPQVMEVPFGTSMALPLSPASIREDGTLLLGVVNGDTTRGVANDDSMTFPPDGLEVYYPVGSYRLNFARVVAVLWLKLAFLAMVGVWAATFLSFPVASLVAFGVFFVAESAGFLINSLEYFATRDQQGNINYFKVLVRAVAVPVANAFGFYSGLRPTGSLVEGRLVGWGTLAKAAALLGLLTSILYAVAVVIFRRRELATYSGQ